MSKQSGRGGMGSHKHYVSGFAPRSPRYKFLQQLEANQNGAVKKRKTPMFGSVHEALENTNPNKDILRKRAKRAK
jgi:hypothetical protein